MSASVLVAGGAGGIGSAIVRRYIESGSRVVIADIDEESGNRIAAESVGSVIFVRTDVTDSQSLRNLRTFLHDERVELNSIISLAGRALHGDFEGLAMSPDVIENSIRLNLTSHLILVRELNGILLDGGSITLVSSINAIASYGLPAYSAAKAGLIGYAKASAREYGLRGVRINVILPGTIPTPATLNEPKNFKELLGSSLLGRLATADEVANLAFELAEKLTGITGQAIVVDCGQSIAREIFSNE